jgi:hypothetical protein
MNKSKMKRSKSHPPVTPGPYTAIDIGHGVYVRGKDGTTIAWLSDTMSINRHSISPEEARANAEFIAEAFRQNERKTK